MIYIVPSKVCRKIFNKEIASILPFEGEKIRNFKILSVSEIFEKRNENPGMVIYTNIWPLSDAGIFDESNLMETGSNIPVSIGILATLSNKVYKINYPRKGDVIYPANDVAYIIFNSTFFFNKGFTEFFRHSVTLSMFGFLANDGIFGRILLMKSFTRNVELEAILQKEYVKAEKVFLKSGMRIHRDESKMVTELK